MKKPIHATITRHNTCTAERIAAHGFVPVLALCRKLVAAGYDPALPLYAYRGDTLALKVRSIGEGAQITVGDNKSGTPGFRRWQDDQERDVEASLVHQNVPGVPDTPDKRVNRWAA